jgi:hypothetical protein
MRKHLDIFAIALLAALLAGGEMLVPVWASYHAEARQEIQLAMLETQEDLRRDAGQVRVDLLEARNDVVREAISLRRELVDCLPAR